MAKRIRLTDRKRQAVDPENDKPFPGNVNRPERKDPQHGRYHTFVQQVNHELPDMRTDWKDNPRNEIGYGLPKAEEGPVMVAKIRAAAAKSVKLAILLLGEKTPEEVIEAQARDFMLMGNKRLNASLKRFVATEQYYKAVEEDEEDDEEDDEKVAAEKKAQEPAAVPVVPSPVEDKKDEKKEEAPKAASEVKKVEEAPKTAATEKKVEEAPKTATEVKAQEPVAVPPTPPAVEDKKDEKKVEEAPKAAAEKKAEEAPKTATAPVKKAEDEKQDDAGTGKLDVEFTSPEEADDDKAVAASEILPDPNDSVLSSIFAGDDMLDEEEEPGDSAPEKEASKKASQGKQGIKSLGGKTVLASDLGSGEADELNALWEDGTPDIHEIWPA